MAFSQRRSVPHIRISVFLSRFTSQGVSEMISSHLAHTDSGKFSSPSVGGRGSGGGALPSPAATAALHNRRQRSMSLFAAGHGASLIASIANEAADGGAASSPTANAMRFSPNVVRRSSVVQLKSAVASTAFAQSAFSAQISAQLGHQLAAQLSTVASSQLAAAAVQSSASTVASVSESAPQPQTSTAGSGSVNQPPAAQAVQLAMPVALPVASPARADQVRFGAGASGSATHHGSDSGRIAAHVTTAGSGDGRAASASSDASGAFSKKLTALDTTASHSNDTGSDAAAQLSAPMVVTNDAFDVDIDIDVWS